MWYKRKEKLGKTIKRKNAWDNAEKGKGERKKERKKRRKKEKSGNVTQKTEKKNKR